MRTIAELTPPLSARSVILSLLLGVESGALPVRAIVRVAGPLGFSPASVRTALSRMVTSGDLRVGEGVYRLGERHRIRQGLQDERVQPKLRHESGEWTMAVVVVTGRDAARRVRTRETLGEARYAELREGTWMRPDNLARRLDPLPDIEVFTLFPENEAAVVARLWDLETWAGEARLIADALRSSEDPATRFAAAAAAVRHLRTDPVLPERLRPDDWPADRLRRAYLDYRKHIAHLTKTEE